MLELGLKTLIAYLAGSVIGGLVVGFLRGGVDIRTVGSGNAGGTNALRTQGFAFAVWVMLIDVGKGLAAVLLLPKMPLPWATHDLEISREWLTVACGAAVVAGHVYPVWFEFRGGKGAATLIGVLAGIQPMALIPVLVAWILTVVLTGYVGLGTMIAAAAYPVYILATAVPVPAAQLAFGVVAVAFICYTHRSNLLRMWSGTENRARRLWLLRPR